MFHIDFFYRSKYDVVDPSTWNVVSSIMRGIEKVSWQGSISSSLVSITDYLHVRQPCTFKIFFRQEWNVANDTRGFRVESTIYVYVIYFVGTLLNLFPQKNIHQKREISLFYSVLPLFCSTLCFSQLGFSPRQAVHELLFLLELVVCSFCNRWPSTRTSSPCKRAPPSSQTREEVPPTLCHPASQLGAEKRWTTWQEEPGGGWRGAGATGKSFWSLSKVNLKVLLSKSCGLFIFCCQCLKRPSGESTCEWNEINFSSLLQK